MKRHDWFISITTLLFSVLFYKQQAGLNYLLFSIAVLVGFAALNTSLLSSKKWWFYATCHLLTAFCVFYHTTSLSIVAYFVSLLIISSKSVYIFQSVIFNFLFGVYSVFSSVVFIILNSIKRHEANKTDAQNPFPWRKAIGVSISIVIALIFFGLYQNANPLFKDFTKDINLDWISFDWCLFTLWGFLMVYALFKHQIIKPIAEVDVEYNRSIIQKESYNTSFLDEVTIVKWVFVLLNLMLLTLNILDINQLYINPKLPANITLSDFVHQSIGAIIFSIVLALAFIIICFRGELNFLQKSKPIKYLIYVWIAQSCLMVISAMVRNNWYISSYALTYLRIGVYVYLGMALAGLILTAYKVNQTKHAWHLTRLNFDVWFLSLCLSTCVDWDKLITNYNIKHSHQVSTVKLDRNYLLGLSETNLPELLLQHPIVSNPNTKDFNHWGFSDEQLSRSLWNFYASYQTRNWQGVSLRANRIHKQLTELHDKGFIKTICLPYENIESLKPLYSCTKIENMTVNATSILTKEFLYFPNLKYLTLKNFNANDLVELKKLKQLEFLCLWSSYPVNLKGIDKIEGLKVLKLHEITDVHLPLLKEAKQLKTVITEKLYDDIAQNLKKECPHLKIIILPSYDNNRQ